MGGWVSLAAGAYSVTQVDSTNGTASSAFTTTSPGTYYLTGRRAAFDYADVMSFATARSFLDPFHYSDFRADPFEQLLVIPDRITNL